MGYRALFSNITGDDNTAVGYMALNMNTGIRNTAVGFEALKLNTGGTGSSAFGYRALFKNTGSGNTNSAFGDEALYNNTTGYLNTALGAWSLRGNISGFRNSAVGFGALDSITTGCYNTAVGNAAGPGSGMITHSNTTAIGNEATTTANNQIRLGNSQVVSIGGYQDWSNVSDARFKQNISQNVPGLEFIMQLNPVSYEMDKKAFDSFIGVEPKEEEVSDAPDKLDRRTGFIAQEVEDIVKEMGLEDFNGVDAPKNDHDYYTLRYAQFVVPLVRAMQEQQEQIEELKEQNKEMKKQINLLLGK